MSVDVHALDMKIRRDFRASFGDDVANELDRDGSLELASALRQAMGDEVRSTSNDGDRDEMRAAEVIIHHVNACVFEARAVWPNAVLKEAYVLAQLRACVNSLRASSDDTDNGLAHAEHAMRAVDTALILGAPADTMRSFVRACELALNVSRAREAYLRSETLFPSVAPVLSSTDGERRMIPCIDATTLSAKEFKRNYYATDQPVVLLSLGEGWPALHKWDDATWWKSFYGHRYVPLEVGDYNDAENWREEMQPMRNFMDDYIIPSIMEQNECPETVAYLAQHQLVDQLDLLVNDFVPPEYCLKSLERINVWMGTSGTVTPCHFDSYDNLFGQVRMIHGC